MHIVYLLVELQLTLVLTHSASSKLLTSGLGLKLG